MRIASWNLNHRVGKTRYQPQAVAAAMALDVDALLFNEYYPQQHRAEFESRLADGGWINQLITDEPPEVANRTFVASRVPVVAAPFALPFFDHQLPGNALAVQFPESGLKVLALRIPAYESPHRGLVAKSWDWLEAWAESVRDQPVAIVGDLNCTPGARPSGGGAHFRRIIGSGWRVATPDGVSYYSARGVTTRPDHLIHTTSVHAVRAEFVATQSGYQLAGARAALSDHAALVAELSAVRDRPAGA
jgi:hypothetical protein